MTSYEKGAPKHLVQYGDPNSDLAFRDTGVVIDDNAMPSQNVVWSSEKIAQFLNGLSNNSNNGLGVGGSINQNGLQGGVNVGQSTASAKINLPWANSKNTGEPERFPNGYRRFAPHFKRPRMLRPSWYLSFVIPSRQHYCDKCCNYLDHVWSTKWNDNPSLANKKCSCSSKCTPPSPSASALMAKN